MGSEPESLSSPSQDAVGDDEDACCSCDCRRRRCSPGAWRRTVKRKLEEVEDGRGRRGEVAARVDVENEAEALREALAGHQQTVAELCAELEEEREASSSAASEALSMILRLQREKAEALMEARQFRRFAEEKMAHDQQELVALEDLLYKREQALQALSCEVQAYRHRFLSYGIAPDSLEPTALDDGGGADTGSPMFDYAPAYEYPQLRCYDNRHRLDPNMDEEEDIDDPDDKYPPGATPRSLEQLRNIEQRIHHLERSQSRTSLAQEMDKGVVMGQSPPPVRVRHAGQLSTDNFGSPLAKEHTGNGKRREQLPATVDRSSDRGDDDSTSDRVYTVDAVHKGAPSLAPTARPCEDYVSTPRESTCRVNGGGREETDIKKLYMRLESLEADRESMRQAIVSMRTDKAQLVLLKEIAQHLYRDASYSPAHLSGDALVSPALSSGKQLVKTTSLLGSFSLMSLIKWILTFIFWRRKSRRSKHIFGLPSNNAGLLLLLENGPRMRQRRCLSRIQVWQGSR